MCSLEKFSIGLPVMISPASLSMYVRRVLPSPFARIWLKAEAVGMPIRASNHPSEFCSQWKICTSCPSVSDCKVRNTAGPDDGDNGFRLGFAEADADECGGDLLVDPSAMQSVLLALALGQFSTGLFLCDAQALGLHGAGGGFLGLLGGAFLGLLLPPLGLLGALALELGALGG